MVKVVAASDIHGKYAKLVIPEGDILVLAGDLLPNFSADKARDSEIQLQWMKDSFVGWLIGLKSIFEHIIIVPGNHDKAFELKEKRCREILSDIDGVKLLINEGTELLGKKFWGSPMSSWFHGQYWSFNLPPSVNGFCQAAVDLWKQIPSSLDVLITHGPAYGILDKCDDGRMVGCPHLMQEVFKKQPKVHICGHIHESYGQASYNGTRFYNAAVCTLQYFPLNPPQIIEI